jgi:hypothetical protein
LIIPMTDTICTTEGIRELELQSAFLLTNPAELDKSLFAGIIYAKRVHNSATVTKP